MRTFSQLGDSFVGLFSGFVSSFTSKDAYYRGTDGRVVAFSETNRYISPTISVGPGSDPRCYDIPPELVPFWEQLQFWKQLQ